MKKLFILLTMLIVGIGSTWADSSWAIYGSDLTQYGWTAMGADTPDDVKALESQVEGKPLAAYYLTEDIDVQHSYVGDIKVLFRYSTGSHRLEILGVDLLDQQGNVVGSDYHFGYSGGQHSKNIYTLTNVPAGSYKIRYIINGSGISNSVGNIWISNDIWNITSSDLTTDSWNAMGDGAPSGLPSGSYTPYSRTQDITISNTACLQLLFNWNNGGDRLEILGVDLLDAENTIVASDYHYGSTGTQNSNNMYFLSGISNLTEGTYKLRYIINKDQNLDDSRGKIKINGMVVADSYANISQWYLLRVHTNTGYYMYYDETATYKYGFTTSSSNVNAEKYLWGFVKSGDGIQVYNKAAGSSIALDDNNPSTISANGVAADFTFKMGKGAIGNLGTTADAYFTLIHTEGYALNYNGGNKRLQQWSGSDAGSTFMIDEAPIVGGKIYKIKAYFTDHADLYFSNNNSTLEYKTSATNGVNDYWILRSTGDTSYPWRFESGRGDGNFLSSTEGLSNTGVYLQINTYGNQFDLRGSKDGDATVSSGIVNLGTWDTSSKTGFGAYGTACWSGTGHTTSGGWTTEYIIEEVTGVDVYTVVSNINAGGVMYTPSYTGTATQTNGGFYILASTPSASDFTAISVTNYTAGDVIVDTSAKTITVNYTATITYTLTDVNGATYSWSASGTYGTAPTITGCYGITISNEVWNEESRTYTADISFPFPISSNEVINWNYIGSFNVKNESSYNPNDFCWFVKSDNKVYIKKATLPTNEDGENEKFKWAIFPTNSNNQFSFKIKNESTGKFLYVAKEEADHTGAEIILSEGGTGFEYFTGDYGQGWKIPIKNLYVSDGSSGDAEQNLGLWNSAHRGTAVAFFEPADFTTLLSNLKTSRNSYNQYFLSWTQGKYTETVEGTMTTTQSQLASDRNVVKDSPTEFFTAAQFKTYTDNYINAVNQLRYVVSPFFRVSNLDGTKYATAYWQDYLNYIQLRFNSSGNDAGSIFYLNDDNNIISFASGSYLFAINHTAPVGYFQYKCTYEFLPGSSVDRIYVHTVNNPSGWGGEEKYWKGGTENVERVVVPTADCDFLIKPVTSLPVTLKASALGYATFCCPVPVKIPSGVEAFVSKIEDNTIKLFRIENFKDASDNVVIPANTAVMLHNKNFSSTDETFLFEIADYSGEGITDNGFYGTIAAESMVAGNTYYSLRTWKVNDVPTKVGFASKTSGSLAGFKAWICEEGQSARNFTIVFDSDSDPTGIIEALGLQNDNVEIYDLNGRKLSSYKRGINIVNGKKVMVQ